MIIYKITNKINGKVYIGQTVGDLHARWRRHVRSKGNANIHKAIRNTQKSNIVGCCKHRPHYNTCKGCRWEYVTDNNEAV